MSAKTGDGLDALRRALTSAASAVRERDRGGPARLPIDRVFSVKGFGTVVTGTLVSGRIRQDDELVGPAARADGQGPRPAGPRPSGRGRRRGAPRRGEPRRHRRGRPGPRRHARARRARSSRRGAWMPSSICCPTRGRCGTARACGSITARRSCSARIAVAAARDGDGTAAEIAPGRSAYARIRFEAPAVLTRGDRFIVRAYSPPVTIGGGVVLDPHPPRSAIRTAAALARYRRLDAAAETTASDSAVLAFMDERGGRRDSRAARSSAAPASRRPSADATRQPAGRRSAARRASAICSCRRPCCRTCPTACWRR